MVRAVTSGFLPGDDWADEFEAMTLGGAHAIGVRTPDALYRFMRGFAKPVIAAHHLFASGAKPARPGKPGSAGR